MIVTHIDRDLTMPKAPVSLEESGLNVDLLVQLALKTLHFSGELSGSELASRLGLPFTVIAPRHELTGPSSTVVVVPVPAPHPASPNAVPGWGGAQLVRACSNARSFRTGFAIVSSVRGWARSRVRDLGDRPR